MKKLVIDLGHGGSDPGAVGPNGTHEANVVLAIGTELNECATRCNMKSIA